MLVTVSLAREENEVMHTTSVVFLSVHQSIDWSMFIHAAGRFRPYSPIKLTRYPSARCGDCAALAQRQKSSLLLVTPIGPLRLC
jgi:hypothetical protein